MKSGAMDSLAHVSSPYHTIQVARPSMKNKDSDRRNKKSSKKSSDRGSSSGLPYTSSDNNLETYGTVMKYQRSNSWGEACEEALSHPGGGGIVAPPVGNVGGHFSPLNTVAGMWCTDSYIRNYI